MTARLLSGLLVAGLILMPARGQAPGSAARVETSHMHGAIKFETPVDGFLAPLNGQVKLRMSEVAFEPGGAIGDHYHSGPGIRYVLTGELTFIHEDGRVERVPAGGTLYEGGDKSIRAENRGAQPAKMLVFEVLPVGWQGGSTVPLSRRADLEQEGARLGTLLCPAQ